MKKKNKTIHMISHNASETKAIGYSLAKFLKAGDVVTLQGPLGAGKTTLVKGLARGLGVRSEKNVSSPTFVLAHEYKGRLPIFHLDWYRLRKVAGSDADTAEECFLSGGVTIVEWPERGKDLIPKSAFCLTLSHAGVDRRRVVLRVP